MQAWTRVKLTKGKAIFVLALVLYFVSLFGGFVQDDYLAIEFNPNMGKPLMLLKVWGQPYSEGGLGDKLYRPLTSFSYYLNGFLFGYNSWGFRLANVILYACLCCLVYETLVLFISTKEGKNHMLPFWLSALFAVMPVHTEAVNNIVGRAELLSLSLFLLAVILYKKKNVFWSVGMLFLSLMSKENAIAGVAILVYLVLAEKQRGSQKIKKILIFVLVGLVYWCLRLHIVGADSFSNSATMVENPLKFMGTDQRIINAFSLVTYGLEKTFFPLSLSYDYSLNVIKTQSQWLNLRTVLGITAMVVSLGSLATCLRKNKMWIMGQGLFWGSILVTGNFLFAAQNNFGERRMMWPSLGIIFMIGAAYVMMKNTYRRRLVLKAFVIIALIFAVRTEIRNFDWLSEESLFLHDVVFAKDSVKAQVNAAHVYLKIEQPEKVREALEKADSIYPNNYQTIFRWGKYYQLKGDQKNAREKYLKCLQIMPGFADCQKALDSIK